MASLIPSESAHWYKADGTPCHSVEKKAGGMRPTNLSDARKLNLFPSVTSVLSIIRSHTLESWIQTQLVEAALTLPQQEGESLDKFARRVVEDSKTKSKEATGFGSKVHNVLESFMRGEEVSDPEVDEFAEPTIEWLRENILDVDIVEEVLVNHREGYAGTVDLVAEVKGVGKAVIDYKTQTIRNGRPNFYPKFPLQLAAYAECVQKPYTPPLELVSVVIDSKKPSKPHVKVWNRNEADYYQLFQGLMNVWKYEKGYAPLNTQPAVEDHSAALPAGF